MPICHTVKRNYLVRCSTRVCLKIAFRQLCVPLCGRFGPDEGGVAGYVDRIGTKYAAKWGVQMAGMNFQTRSGPGSNDTTGMCEDSPFPYSFWYGKIGR